MKTTLELNDIIKSLLQKTLTFTINDTIYKQGKLLLFKYNNYHIEFTLSDKSKKQKKIEIPIPYDVELTSNNILYFDYKLKTLSHKNDKVLKLLKLIQRKGKSKFYDNIMEIKYE